MGRYGKRRFSRPLACLTALIALYGFGAAVPAAPARAQAPTAVQWYVMDYPPAYIVHGADRGTGYQDKILNYFAANLPAFRIERQSASLARLLSNLATGNGVCSGSLGRTPEREQHMIFSKPILYSLPTRLVVTEASAERVGKLRGADGKIRLDALAGAGFMKVGVVKGRTYGTLLDGFLGKLEPHVSAGRAELVFRMLARGRVDYSFAFPDEVGYYGRDNMVSDDHTGFETFPIAGMPDVLPSYFACSNDAVGRQVIAAVDKVIARNGQAMPWTRYYLAWIDKNARRDVELAQASKPK